MRTLRLPLITNAHPLTVPHQKLRYTSNDSMETTSAPSGSSFTGLLCLRLKDRESYEQFVDTLTPMGELFHCLSRQGIKAQPDEFETVEISRLSTIDASILPGLNEAKCVCIDSSSQTSDQASQPTLYVFKGADFSAWLERRHEKRPWNVYKRALYSEHSLNQELYHSSTSQHHSAAAHSCDNSNVT